MDVLHRYLQKYATLAPPQASKTKLIAEVILHECGISIEHTSIEVRRGGAVLSCHPAIRSEIVRRAPVLLEVLYTKHKLRLSFLR